MDKHELAAAIRRGDKMIKEVAVPWYGIEIDGSPCGCALGAAMAGSGQPMPTQNLVHNTETIARVLGIDIELARKVSNKHFGGAGISGNGVISMPRLAIADWLDQLDVAKPKDAQTFDDFKRAMLVPVDVEAVGQRVE